MGFIRTRMSVWRKYSSRIFFLLILLIFAGCSDTCLRSTEQPCGKRLSFQWGVPEPVVLTSTNPAWKQITDDACGADSCTYTVTYQYRDISTYSKEGSGIVYKDASEQERPPLTVKVGTTEKGTQKIGDKSFSNGWWSVSGVIQPPPTKKGEKVVPCHYVIQITMQQPLIKLPGKAPTIELPFIGPIIGPKPKDVEFKVSIEYSEVNTRYNPTIK